MRDAKLWKGDHHHYVHSFPMTISCLIIPQRRMLSLYLGKMFRLPLFKKKNYYYLHKEQSKINDEG
jgi:hypothetical protein